jgi:hypothetical protein
MHVLDQIIQGCLNAERPIVVFDLDSTLFSTAERNLRILHEFAREPDTPDEMCQMIAELDVSHMGWNVVSDLAKRGYADHGILGRLKEYWYDRFFTDEYARTDEPLPGAVAYTHQCADAGALIYYLTGRDEPNMGVGTRDSLRAHRFPLDVPHAVLRLKPRFEMQDLAFKREVMTELHDLGQVIACFENEPLNANTFAEAFPAAHVVFLDTVHSPDPPPLDSRIARLKDFRR